LQDKKSEKSWKFLKFFEKIMSCFDANCVPITHCEGKFLRITPLIAAKTAGEKEKGQKQ